ncbi:hypothetical protein C8A00DRAFT_42705 [Chaetomidium leptoderma]|uniref:Rhodopsin domain-containing protein n=1 Tax=Chaetomidium leptoderma TaxID=669021 RepID=A0AAN6VMY2_9PEZI|nr:hypothetical protein C8A00DRAFT_42705 [Chaetomidium leptoderma]
MPTSRGGAVRPGAGSSMADLPHDDLGPNMNAAAFTTWTIALIFVLLRFWTRARIVHALGMADWVIALSLIAAGGMCISIVEQNKYGMGKHVWDIVDFEPAMMEAWWFSLLCYVLTLALTKVSICLLYLTIFTFEWARRACFAVLFIVVITNLWAVATTLTYCIPLQATWDPTVIASFCQSQDAWWANTGMIIVTDIIIFILPIPLVLPLKLPRRQKFVVVGIFALGFFVCLVSLIRLAILVQVKGSTDQDFTYSGTSLSYWTVIEVHTAIVVACSMTLKPLVTTLFPNLLAPHSHRDSSKDEPSAASSGPPLTIGSKPSRQVPLPGQLHMEHGDHGVDVMLGDIERGFGGGDHVGGDGSGGNGMAGEDKSSSASGSGPASERSTIKNGEVELVYHHSPWTRGAVSTDDLGSEMTARSIG